MVNDRGASVGALLSNLGWNALGGGVIVVLMVTLFLGGRQATVVSISIPLSAARQVQRLVRCSLGPAMRSHRCVVRVHQRHEVLGDYAAGNADPWIARLLIDH